jgi:hypothetical protein
MHKYFAIMAVNLFLLNVLQAQNPYFSYKTVKYAEDPESFSFPLFFHAKDSLSTQKMNQFLQLSELSLLKGFEKDNIFEQIMYDEAAKGGMEELNVTILENTPTVLAVEINSSYLSATSFHSTTYHNFNAQNGELIHFKDLFTETGYKVVLDLLVKKQISQLKKEIAKIKKDEISEDFELIMQEYQQDKSPNFYLKGKNIYVNGINHFPRGMNLSGAETVCKIGLNEGLEENLSEYGKQVFGISTGNMNEFHSQSLPQLFSGVLAGQKVLMILESNTYENGITGKYAYMKHGIGINLSGKWSNTTLDLTEQTADFEDNGYIHATFDGFEMTGTWTNKDRKKSYKLSLKR